MSYDEVSDRDLVAVVTFLEMHARPQVEVPPSPWKLRRIEDPEPGAYRELFASIGSRWLWFSRLVMADGDLSAIIQDPKVELFSVEDEAGRAVGMLELDYRQPGECELSFVGVLPELSGQGHGRWLLAEAVDRAWRDGVRRVHVHTCTLDHPAALSAYRRAGFTPYKRAIERFPDPRLIGALPRDCAPQIPLLGTLA
ncbi:GNAT family N-acetyltransferase [Sphingomonas daechungensis]|uniref:GNAT family N-acetyltransferase n=1 Tax=Sphingomonas daechungensis TaxID=1176646 RepID=A0ABX6T0J2_9SPHN|nr:GNAT family N-acetyltransferase [Sphingomonas daechungensis]QNP43331.1 GNAT family N-acetyltransferase [Sphingomonas daechungensis]